MLVSSPRSSTPGSHLERTALIMSRPDPRQRTRRILPLALALILLSGCSFGSPPPSAAPASASGSSPVTGVNACGPVNLRSPHGETVDLNGEWGGGDWFITPGTGERTFVQQVGDCVWMAISDDQFRERPEENASLLAVFEGRITPDFSVTGNLVTLLRWVDPFTYGNQSVMTEVRMRIEFDADGSTRLVEDRVQGVVGPRCPNAEFWCPAPTVLRKIVAEPGPSPT